MSYGIYLPVIRAIEKHPNLEHSIIATCMHLSKEYGHTIDEIKKEIGLVQNSFTRVLEPLAENTKK